MIHHRDPQTKVNAYGHRIFTPHATEVDAEPSSPAPGEPTACWQLWEARQAHFRQLCLRWLNGNQADAEDALNTAALVVWRKTHEPTPTIITPMAWLTGIVRHICVDIHRKRRQEANYTAEIDALDTENRRDASSSASRCHSPETLFLQREQCVYLQAEMAALPERLRIPLHLRSCAELTYEEIATQLGLTTITVRKRIQHARTLLSRKLHRYLIGQTGPDLHAPWPDEHTLFTVSILADPVDGDDEATALQPRVVALTEVSKREEQKLRTLRTYVQCYPSGWKKRLALADQLCKMGEQAEAIVVYEQVLEKQPQLLSVWVQVGRVYEVLQRGEAAVAAYERALSLVATAAMRDAIGELIEGVATADDE